MKLLLDRGVNAGAQLRAGETPLHWVVHGPHLEIARMLLDRGAPIDAKDRNGATPFDWLVMQLARASDAEDIAAYRELADMFKRAGAVLDPAWYEADPRRRRALAKFHEA